MNQRIEYREVKVINIRHKVINDFRILYGPQCINRIIRKLFGEMRGLLAGGYSVYLEDVCTIHPQHLRQREFRSNLPQHKGRKFRSKLRTRLQIEPHGSLKKSLESGYLPRSFGK